MRTQTVIPKGMIPGSPENVRGLVKNAMHYCRFVERDARPLIEFCQEIREQEGWKVHFQDEPKTWERFCREVLGYPPMFIETIEAAIWFVDAEEKDTSHEN